MQPITTRDADDLGALELARALFARLDDAGIAWCVVGDSSDLDATVRSDVDIVVDPAALPRIPSLLDGFARAHGARIVQALRHEAVACWYALAWRVPGRRAVGFLHPDICGDWWRGGRCFLPAEAVLAGRVRDAAGFNRPRPARNALYYLLKRIHKGELGPTHAAFIAREWNSEPREACKLAARWFSSSRVETLAAACAARDFADILSHLGAWRRDIERQVPGRVGERLSEAARRVGRVLRPTGVVVETAAELRDAETQAFLARWCRAFRRAARWRGGGAFSSLRLGQALVRSTLLVAEAGRDLPVPRLGRAGTRIRLPAALWGTEAGDQAMLDLLARRASARLGLRHERESAPLSARVPA
jgi:hypothetical protein